MDIVMVNLTNNGIFDGFLAISISFTFFLPEVLLEGIDSPM